MRIKSIAILLIILLVLGGYFYFTNTDKSATQEEPEIFVWNINMDEIQHIEISLPREGRSETFIKISHGDEFPWFFDNPERSPVDTTRWGGGIPLILSGPSAKRLIAQNATAEKLAEFGLAQPRMEIVLTLENGNIMNIKVGDSAPDETTYYVQVPDSNNVCLVDYTWYDVLERLVTEPPYAAPTS